MLRQLNSVFCSILLGVLILASVGCSQKEEPSTTAAKKPETENQVAKKPQVEPLTVFILDVKDYPASKIVNQQFSGQLADLGHKVQTVEITLDMTGEKIIQETRNADLIVFSSLLNEKFRPLKTSLHAMQGQNLPESLQAAFAGSDAGTQWASVIAIDPILAIQEIGAARLIGKTEGLESWNDLRTLAEVCRVREETSDLLAWLDRDKDLSDGIHAYLYAFGAQNRLNKNADPGWIATLNQGLANDRRLMTDQFENPMQNLPTIHDLAELADNKANVTIARYSQYALAPDAVKQQLQPRLLSNVVGDQTPAYTIAAAVTLQSPHPDAALKLAQSLTNHEIPWAGGADQQVRDMGKNAVWALRESVSSLNDADAKKLFNNEANLEETLDSMMKQYFHAPEES
ncbi:MAG: hypothetical protein GC154_21675 [bacterium]|nr:hypothetical protein [bacterium]